MNKQFKAGLVAAATLLVAALSAGTALAQASDKAVAVEAVPAAPAFTQWVGTVMVAPDPVPAAQVTTLPFSAVVAPATVAPYEPWPVVLGLPELPLVGQGAREAARHWGAKFNYQGLFVRLLVLDASGRRIESRPISQPPRPGERFKIRMASTFDAVSEVGVVRGEVWTSQRVGQLYPQPGTSVQLRAGEAVDLPLDPGQYFQMGTTPLERLVLSVRHPGATGETRSLQPAYRQDIRGGSAYLQLVPSGRFPAIEQVVSAASVR